MRSLTGFTVPFRNVPAQASRVKPQSLSPYRTALRPGWLLKWISPQGHRSTASLGTRDETEAKTIALDLERLLNDPSLWDIKDLDPRCVHFHPKALQILCGQPVRAQPSTAPVSEHAIRFFRTMPAQFGVKNWYVPVPELHDLRVKLAERDRAIARLEAEKQAWNRERLELHKRLNKHCKVSIGEALDEFERYYTVGHAPQTTKQVLRVNRQLAALAGADTLLSFAQVM